MKDATLVIQGVYFVSQALLLSPWVAAVRYLLDDLKGQK
jgi:hypothetical protein